MRLAHIRNERATREATGRIGDGRPLPRRIGVGWCGVDCSSEWFFMDADTLLLDLAYGTVPVGTEPCAECVKAMADLLATSRPKPMPTIEAIYCAGGSVFDDEEP